MSWHEVLLVTGGSGFIGSWIARELALKHPQYLVVVYDSFSYSSSPMNITEPSQPPNLHVVEGDICDGINLAKVFETYRFTIVLHLAAETHVDQSFDHATRFVNANVVGTQVVLETTRRAAKKVRKFIYFSTDEVYGATAPDTAAKETDILRPSNPYSATKASGDLLVLAYQTSFGIPAIIVRCTNVYGPKQYPEKVIPKFLGHISRGEACPIQGSGHQMRTYIHAQDVASAIDAIISHGETGEIYNVGTDSCLSTLELLDVLLLESGLDPQSLAVRRKFVGHVADRPFNDSRYFLDYSKIAKLGWAPSISFRQGIRQTVEWYNRHGMTWWSDMF